VLRRLRDAGEARLSLHLPQPPGPCKHALGLLYALAQGKAFAEADVPDDLAAKREKAAARVERRKADPDRPAKVDKAALAKKIRAQLEGIDLLERLTLVGHLACMWP
jgi:hypothetical protein